MGQSKNELDLLLDSQSQCGQSPDPVGLRDGFGNRLAAARDGSVSAMGCVLEDCRNYLLLIANRELGDSIQAKIGASDLVQETFCQAHQIFDRFEGSSRRELATWLARILDFKLAQTRRRFVHSEKRDVTRERPLHLAVESVVRDARRREGWQPEQAAAVREEFEEFERVLAELPEDYRLAIKLRSIQTQSFAALGRALGRSADAARMTWARAVLRLRKEMRVRRMRAVGQDANGHLNP